MSSCTRLLPRSALAPLSRYTSVTMPATWEVMSTPCEEMSVPIEVSCSTHFSVRAGSEVTVAGGGTCDAMIVLIMFGLNRKLNQTSPPSRRAATAAVTMKRRVMADFVAGERSASPRSTESGFLPAAQPRKGPAVSTATPRRPRLKGA